MKRVLRASVLALCLMFVCMTLFACADTQNNANKDGYNVIFVYNYKGSPDAVVKTVKNGETVAAIAEPQRDGYVFSGWYTNVAGTGEEYSFDKSVTADIKLFAKWEQTEATVTFKFNGGKSTNGETEWKSKVSLGEKVAEPNVIPTRDKYAFKGWSSNSSGTVQFDFNSEIRRNTTIYAVWEQTEADVTIVFGNGTADFTRRVSVNTVLQKPEDPSRDYYGFIGWFANSAYTIEFDFNAPVKTDVTIYAGWRLEIATVTFSANYAGGDNIDVQHVNVASKATRPADPAREGYDFVGWFEDAACTKEFDFDSEINDNITVYAGWKVKTFTVSYVDRNNVLHEVEVEYGATATDPEDPTRTGYTFLGWYTKQTGGEMYAGEPITSDLTLYARWERGSSDPSQVRTITLMLNYDGAGVYQTVTVKGSSNYSVYSNLPKTDPERSGYFFAGWYMEAECETPLASGYRTRESITLYAKWLKTYTFEAEYTNLHNNMQWNGASDNGVTSSIGGVYGTLVAAATDMNNQDELVGNVSNGYFVQKLFYYGATIEFHVTSDKAVSGAALTLRLSPDMFDLHFKGTQNYKITVNDQTYYLDYDLTGAYTSDTPGKHGMSNKRPFENYLISTTVSLNKGDNVIKLIVNNNIAHEGTMWAEAPLVDCIYVASDSTLSWTDGYCFPLQVGQSTANFKCDLYVERRKED